MKINLTISAEYVNHWSVYDALRELYQNAIDRQNEDLSTTMITKRYNQVVEVGNKNTSISRNTLILGKTNKNEGTYLGQFGEGYKLALLVLLRNGHPVGIINGRERWTPRIEYVEELDARVLTIEIEDNVYCYGQNDLLFYIDGITDKILYEYQLQNLHLREYSYLEGESGQVLLDDCDRGKMFVGGLFIGLVPGYEYGYNFNPGVIPIDRDRKQLPHFDMAWQASRILGSLEGFESQINDMLYEEAKDVQYLDSHITRDKANNLFHKFKERFGPASVPVSTEYNKKEMTKKYSGVYPVTVNSTLAEVLQRSSEYKEFLNNLEQNEIKSPKQILEEFLNRYEEYTTPVLKQAFIEELLPLSEGWREE